MAGEREHKKPNWRNPTVSGHEPNISTQIFREQKETVDSQADEPNKATN